MQRRETVSAAHKSTYVFVGSNMSDMMGVVSFRRFGQRAELTDEQARDLALGGSAIVPAAQFDALGFGEVDLRKHGEFGSHAALPDAFVEKQRAAIMAYDGYRASLEKVEKEAEIG
jgi:hypothetical protein